MSKSSKIKLIHILSIFVIVNNKTKTVVIVPMKLNQNIKQKLQLSTS